MRDLNDLYYFAKVVEYGGFAAAERAIDVPKSRLSRRVAQLEKRLGVRLIQRSSRKFSVTDIGSRYYEHCRAMLLEADAAQDLVDVNRAEPRGIVRLSCPTELLRSHVEEMLARYMAQCPHVQIDLEATNRRVDVINEHLDMAIRVRFPPLEDSDLVMRKLGDSPQWLVASPTLLAARGPVHDPSDLPRFPSLDWHKANPQHVWSLAGVDGETARIVHQPRLITADQDMLRRAAIDGMGVVKLPVLRIYEDVRAGTLCRLLPDWKLRPGVVHVVFPSRRGLLPRVRELIDFLAAQFEALPTIATQAD